MNRIQRKNKINKLIITEQHQWQKQIEFSIESDLRGNCPPSRQKCETYCMNLPRSLSLSLRFPYCSRSDMRFVYC